MSKDTDNSSLGYMFHFLALIIVYVVLYKVYHIIQRVCPDDNKPIPTQQP